VERWNRTISEMERCMLQCKEIPNKYWAEIMYTAVYLLNIGPTKIIQDIKPEAWSRRKPQGSDLKKMVL
jgi:hypothetical protein